MKKVLSILLLAALLVSVSCKPIKKKGDGFTIKGTVTANTKGWVYLKELKKKEYVVIDSVQIAENQFTFTGKVSEPTVYFITPEQTGKKVAVYVENSDITLDLDGDWNIKTISGSDNTALFNDLQAKANDGTLNADSIVKLYPNSPIGVYFLNKQTYKYDYNQLSSFRKMLNDSIKNHQYVVQLDETLKSMSNVQAGKVAPDFTLPNIKGDTLSLNSLKGKYVLIDFWASWCPDCRKSNPELVKIYHKYKRKNFTILGVSIDEDKQKWMDAVAKDRLVWDNVITNGGWENPVTAAYAIKWIPMGFLIDPNGVIIMSGAEPAQLDAKLAEILK